MNQPGKAIRYWIQRADFSTEERSASGAAEIMGAFGAHPWARELELEESLQQAGMENCQPGLGISEDDWLLHLCPTRTDLGVYYHYKRQRRILGLPLSGAVQQTAADVPLSAANELIAAFVERDHNRVMDLLG